jgi:hypothetical protein
MPKRAQVVGWCARSYSRLDVVVRSLDQEAIATILTEDHRRSMYRTERPDDLQCHRCLRRLVLSIGQENIIYRCNAIGTNELIANLSIARRRFHSRCWALCPQVLERCLTHAAVPSAYVRCQGRSDSASCIGARAPLRWMRFWRQVKGRLHGLLCASNTTRRTVDPACRLALGTWFSATRFFFASRRFKGFAPHGVNCG